MAADRAGRQLASHKDVSGKGVAGHEEGPERGRLEILLQELGARLAAGAASFAQDPEQQGAQGHGEQDSADDRARRPLLVAAGSFVIFSRLAESMGAPVEPVRSQLFDSLSKELYIALFSQDRPGGLEYFRLLMSSSIETLERESAIPDVSDGQEAALHICRLIEQAEGGLAEDGEEADQCCGLKSRVISFLADSRLMETAEALT